MFALHIAVSEAIHMHTNTYIRLYITWSYIYIIHSCKAIPGSMRYRTAVFDTLHSQWYGLRNHMSMLHLVISLSPTSKSWAFRRTGRQIWRKSYESYYVSCACRLRIFHSIYLYILKQRAGIGISTEQQIDTCACTDGEYVSRECYPLSIICSNKKRWEWRMQLAIRTHRCCSFIRYILCNVLRLIFTNNNNNSAMKRRDSAVMANLGILLFQRQKFKWKQNKKIMKKVPQKEICTQTPTTMDCHTHTHSLCVWYLVFGVIWPFKQTITL